MLHLNSNETYNLNTDKDIVFLKEEPVVMRLSSVYTHCKTIRKDMVETGENDKS